MRRKWSDEPASLPWPRLDGHMIGTVSCRARKTASSLMFCGFEEQSNLETGHWTCSQTFRRWSPASESTASPPWATRNRVSGAVEHSLPPEASPRRTRRVGALSAVRRPSRQWRPRPPADQKGCRCGHAPQHGGKASSPNVRLLISVRLYLPLPFACAVGDYTAKELVSWAWYSQAGRMNSSWIDCR
jgi:hypothetical protein